MIFARRGYKPLQLKINTVTSVFTHQKIRIKKGVIMDINESKMIAESICKCLSAKKAHDIVKIYVADKTIIADYFVIAGGRSTTQVRALCDAVEEYMSKEYSLDVRRREGVSEGRWAVLDFGEVIVHVFDDEQRLFYHLERLWGEGEKYEDEDEAGSAD